jgi:hypothetical protein
VTRAVTGLEARHFPARTVAFSGAALYAASDAGAGSVLRQLFVIGLLTETLFLIMNGRDLRMFRRLAGTDISSKQEAFEPRVL